MAETGMKTAGLPQQEYTFRATAWPNGKKRASDGTRGYEREIIKRPETRGYLRTSFVL